MVILMGQQGGTCWNLIQGNNPEFFGGANNAWNWSFCPYKDLFQECPPRPHHPRVWGFLLPTDRTPHDSNGPTSAARNSRYGIGSPPDNRSSLSTRDCGTSL